MRNISCGCSSGIAEIFSSVTVAAGKRFPKSTTIATKTVLGNLIMCNLPPDSQQALAIFGRRSPFKASGPVALVFLRLTQQLSQIRDRLQVAAARLLWKIEKAY